MKRDKMRGELRRLKRENARLKKANSDLFMNNLFYRMRLNLSCLNGSVYHQVFKSVFFIDEVMFYACGGFPGNNLKENALSLFCRDFVECLKESGMIHQKVKGNVIETKIKYCLFPIEEGKE